MIFFELKIVAKVAKINKTHLQKWQNQRNFFAKVADWFTIILGGYQNDCQKSGEIYKKMDS